MHSIYFILFIFFFINFFFLQNKTATFRLYSGGGEGRVAILAGPTLTACYHS